MADKIWLDSETYSETDLKTRGVFNYADTAFPIVITYAFDDEPVEVWEIGQPLPEKLVTEIKNGVPVYAHNALFDYMILKDVLGLKLEQMRDTMAIATANHLPANLDQMCKMLGVELGKLSSGKALIRKFCIPNKKGERVTKEDEPDKWEEFVEYAVRDVEAMRSATSMCYELSDKEQAVWVLTQQMNLTGVPVNVETSKQFIEVSDAVKERLNARLVEITGIGKVTQNAKLLQWFRDKGVDTSSLDKASVRAMLADDTLNDELKEVLLIKKHGTLSSLAKYGVFVNTAHNGRIKGAYMYHGASTGRYASRGGLNLQNIPRGSGDPITTYETLQQIHDADTYQMLYGDSLMPFSTAIRPTIEAPKGFTFVNYDYSSIENRVAPWIGGEDSHLELFRKGLDEYKDFATEVYHVPYDQVTNEMRQMSKPSVLGCFAPGTEVLTNNGWKPIVSVGYSDKVFDGIEFVEHDGVINQGRKECICVDGVWVTPDHPFLVGEETWAQAGELNTKLLKSAHGLGAEQLSQMCTQKTDTVCKGHGARVGARKNLISRRYIKDVVTAVRIAVERNNLKGKTPYTRVLISLERLLTLTQTDFTRFVDGVRTRPTQSTRIMVGEEYDNISEMRCLLSRTYQVWRGLETYLSKSTASTTMAIIERVIFDLLHGKSSALILEQIARLNTKDERTRCQNFGGCLHPVTETLARSDEKFVKGLARSGLSPSKTNAEVRVSETFDILNCGKRHRFMIRTDHGVCIVHNCVFGSGAKGLQGYYGQFGIEIELEEAERLVKTYRAKHAGITKAWYAFGNKAMLAVNHKGKTYSTNRCKLKFDGRYLRLQLPSGRVIQWFNPQVKEVKTPWGEYRPAVTVMVKPEQGYNWVRRALIGSSIFQSVVQATARDILVEAMMKLRDAGYKLVMTTHDEIQAEVQEDWDNTEEFERLMTEPPEWGQEIPLAVEGWVGRNYRK